jgi:nickel superoxide dismutase
MSYKIIHKLDKLFHFPEAKAHCDVPCGIYDPITAQIDALTVVRMMDLMEALASGDEKSRKDFHNSMSRYITVKEEHAENAKREIRVIWGDFIKDAHVEKFPQLPGLVHKIMQLGSKCRQTADRDQGLAFVSAINEFAEIFWSIKEIQTKKAKAPYAPALEMVYPDL